ncbi:hypothetical protein ACQ4LE_001439 [Meloidogyne hapla]
MDITLPTFSSDESEGEAKPNIVQQRRPKPILNRCNEAILKRQIAILQENPFTESYATIIGRRENFDLIIEIIQMASCSCVPIDATWLTKRFNELTNDSDQLEDLDFCRKHILKYAQAAEYEAQLKLNNDKIISRQLLKIRLKVDEKDNSNSFKNRSSHRKRTRTSFENPVPSDDEFDPYLKRKEEIEDIFVKQPSPVPEPAPKVTIIDSNDDYSIQPLNNVSQAIHIPIASIDKIKPKPNEPTRRQQIIQRISGDTYDSVPPNYVFGTRGRNRQKIKQNKIKQPKPSATKSRVHLESIQKPQNSRDNTFSCQDEILSSSSSDIEDSELEDVSPSSSIQSIRLYSSSSSSIQLIKTKKSASLKSTLKQMNGIRCKKTVHYTEDTLFPSVFQATSPAFAKHQTVTLPGQTTKIFTKTHRILSSRENTPAVASESSTLYKKVPSSDFPIKISRRDNPLIKKPQEIADLKENIRKEFMELLNKFFSFTYRVSRLFIVDSIMEPLDIDVFKNMSIFSMGYPRMPEWFLYALDRWWTDGQKHFYFSKVFILLGMDLNIYYADPEARQEEVVINFLKNLHAWFDDKMRKVQNDIKSNLERNNQTVCVMKNVEDQDGKPLSVPQYPLRLAHIPYFVVITVPELGDWEVFFQGLNDRLRQFVTANKRNFTLLDWANILKKMKPDDVSTVEKRTAVLIREMHYEHGVLYH